jgi:hypothetical protein
MRRSASHRGLSAAFLAALLGACASKHRNGRDASRVPVVPAPTRVVTPPRPPPVRPAWTGVVPVTVDARDAHPASLAVHIPDDLDATQPFTLVIYFHGSSVCAPEFVFAGEFDRTLCPHPAPVEIGAAGGSRVDAANARAVLVAPQLFTGLDRRFGEAGYFARLLDAMLRTSLASRIPGASLARVDRIILVAHSAGAGVMEHVLARGGIADRVAGVVSMDGSMTGSADYLRWLRATPRGERRRFVSIEGAVAASTRITRAIASSWGSAHAADVSIGVEPVETAVRTHSITSIRSPYDHGWIPLLYLTKVLRGFDLPSREPENLPLQSSTMAPEPLRVGDTETARLLAGDESTPDGARFRDYELTLEANASVEITLLGDRSETEPAALDMRVIVARDGAVVASDDDGGAALGPNAGRFDSRLVFTSPQQATYLLRVTTAPGMHLGAYRLDAREGGRSSTL